MRAQWVCARERRIALNKRSSINRYTVTTRMTPVLRWAAMRAILMFHNCEGQSHKTVSTDHNLRRERRAEADSNRGPSAADQPNAWPLGQTGSLGCFLGRSFHLFKRQIVSGEGTGEDRDLRRRGPMEWCGWNYTNATHCHHLPVPNKPPRFCGRTAKWSRSLTTRMTPVLRWAAVWAILMLHSLWMNNGTIRLWPWPATSEEKGEPKQSRTAVVCLHAYRYDCNHRPNQLTNYPLAVWHK